MANLQNRNPNNREVPPNPNNGQAHGTPTPHTPTTNIDPGKAVSYRDGYVHGRVNERRAQEEGLEVRDNSNAARGLLLGIGLTSLVGLTLGALFLLNQRDQAEEYTAPAPIVVPSAVSPSPSPSPSPEASQPPTVIERTRTIEKPVIIREQVPASPAPRSSGTSGASGQPAQTRQNTTINVTPPAQPQTQNRTGNTNPAPTQIQNQAPATGANSSQSGAATRIAPNQTQSGTSGATQPGTTDQAAPDQTLNQTGTGDDDAPSGTQGTTNGTSTGDATTGGTSTNGTSTSGQ